MIIQAEALRNLTAAIFERAGCDRDEAERVARYLVEANLTGHDSHGVIRIPRYVSAVHRGDTVTGRKIEVVTDSGTLAVVDGGFGFGQTVGEQAVLLGIEKAKEHGSSVIGLRNCAHLGRIGDWAELAAAHGMVSIHFVNTSGIGILVAPFGASEGRMSTNPVAVGVPRDGQPPLILDFATSIVAEGKILVAINGGKPLPEGAFVAADGSFTTDPEVVYGPLENGQPPAKRSGTGAIRAMGLHKGSGLSIVCELLAGALTGGGAADPSVKKLSNNMLSIFMDTAQFQLGGGFAAEVERFIDFAKSARPTERDGEVLMPGDPERRYREQRGRDGIPLPDRAWEAISQAARDVGLNNTEIDAYGGV